MGLLNYTTKIEPEQTISEIQRMLSRHNVAAMMTEYDGPNVAAVSFKLELEGKPISFKSPCNWRAVAEIFRKEGVRPKHGGTLEAQATRTAWRIIKVWVEAQLALVEVNMVTVPQVFLPYAIMRDGRLLSEHVATDPTFLLGEGH
jgi:hypothetical protein